MANLSSPAANVTDQTRREFYSEALKAKQALEAAQREVTALNGSYRSILKRAKKAGVETDAITFALAARHLDPDEVLKEQQARMRMLALSGVMPTIQTDLFKGLEVKLSDQDQEKISAERAWDDGYFAGNNGHTRTTNKHLQGTDEHDAWDRGWIAGQEKIVNEMAPKVKAKTPRKGKGGAAAAGAIN